MAADIAYGDTETPVRLHNEVEVVPPCQHCRANGSSNIKTRQRCHCGIEALLNFMGDLQVKLLLLLFPQLGYVFQHGDKMSNLSVLIFH